GGGVFVIDLLTPLGIAVWILYFLPIALTVLGRDPRAPMIAASISTLLMLFTVVTDAPGIAPSIGYFNRLVGIVVIWAIAILARNLISNRNLVETEDWIRSEHNHLLERLQGDLSLREIGDRALGL